MGHTGRAGTAFRMHRALLFREFALVAHGKSRRRQRNNSWDDPSTKVDVQFYLDAKDALLNALTE